MRAIILVLCFFLFCSSTGAQKMECYNRLLQRGIEEYNKNNLDQAILKWQAAKECPGITSKENKVLDEWIGQTKKQIPLRAKQSPDSGKIIIIRDTLIRNFIRIDTLIVEKQKIVYRDKPEPYHVYGKGNCKVVIYSTCGNRGSIMVWIDGNYVGVLNNYFSESIPDPDCDNIYTVQKITVSGVHHIQTRDAHNGTTDFYITVKEDACYLNSIGCK